MASDVELIPTNDNQRRLISNNDDSIFASPGFSKPQPVSFAQAKRILQRCGLDDKLVLWEECNRLMAMSREALNAKQAAIQALSDQLQQAKEQLTCEQQAYAKIVVEEEALEADSGWLRQHIQTLLSEKRAIQEEVERLKTANLFLLQERDLVFDQLEVAIKLAKERAAQVALQDANAALQRHVQRLQDQLAAQQAQHAEREGQLLACLSQTTKAHMEAMQRLGKGGHVPLDAAVRPLDSVSEVEGAQLHMLSLGPLT